MLYFLENSLWSSQFRGGVGKEKKKGEDSQTEKGMGGTKSQKMYKFPPHLWKVLEKTLPAKKSGQSAKKRSDFTIQKKSFFGWWGEGDKARGNSQ